MKSMESVKDQTKKVLIEILPSVSPETLSDETNIFSLGLGSVDAMMLVEKLEKAFDIKFSNSEINFEVFQNLGNIIELIEKKNDSK